MPRIAANVAFHAFPDPAAWMQAAATGIAAAMQVALSTGAPARLLLSGGSTPGPVYESLATQLADWSRVSISLIDERWLPPGDANSNGSLVRDSLLLSRGAQAAAFVPLLLPGHSLSACVSAANQDFRSGAVMVFGMGPDGHVASLFPAMHGLDAALSSAEPYTAVDATGCAAAGPWHERISLTPAGARTASHRVLLIRGAEKRQLFSMASQQSGSLQLPVALLAALPGNPLQVYWCP